ncbi:MAG: hypothetical protein IJU30_03645, partial [Lachnospiraceae bacterium]|nr:hypothetical protein [Lachnospiraceae bacterium]
YVQNKQEGLKMMDAIRAWYDEQHLIIKVMIHIALIALVLAVMHFLVGPVAFEAGRALRRLVDSLMANC